jgi:hypothetical protein
METTEKIVEAYVRYMKQWFTIPNVRCRGQMEIDLLAIDVSEPHTIRRYHIESGVSISGPFSQLTDKPYSSTDLRTRVKQPKQRRTLGYFTERKFSDPGVVETLRAYGFVPGNYSKIVVSWGWRSGVQEAAESQGVELWDFRNLLLEIANSAGTQKTHFTDDTLRTLQLMAMAGRRKLKASSPGRAQ